MSSVHCATCEAPAELELTKRSLSAPRDEDAVATEPSPLAARLMIVCRLVPPCSSRTIAGGPRHRCLRVGLGNLTQKVDHKLHLGA